MSSLPGKRTRSERVATIQQDRGNVNRLLEWFQDGANWTRVGIAVLAAVALLVACQCWKPPFVYRVGQIPPRDLMAHATFPFYDAGETELQQRQQRREVLVFYGNRTQPLTQCRQALRDRLFLIGGVSSLDSMNADVRRAWAEFYTGDENDEQQAAVTVEFAAMRSLLSVDPKLELTESAIQTVFLPYYESGLLRSLNHSMEEGSQLSIRVYLEGSPEDAHPVEVDRVRIVQAVQSMNARLTAEFRARFTGEWPDVAAKLIGGWLSTRLPETLTYDKERSERERREAAARIGPVMTTYYAGESKLAVAGRPLGIGGPSQMKSLELLRAEWESVIGQMSWLDRAIRLSAYMGMMLAIYLLVGAYIFFVHDRRLLESGSDLARLLALFVATLVFCRLLSATNRPLEVIPICISAMTATVVYGRQLALLLTATSCIAVTLLTGQDLAALVAFCAAGISCVLLLGRIRNRQRLVYVGLTAAAITVASVMGVGFVTSGPVAVAVPVDSLTTSGTPSTGLGTLFHSLMTQASWSGTGCALSGFFMAGLLPFVERGFRVQTDLSLLELGDASHPLLRQLAQRAPSTYNHSINVASIAEAAAEAIGANGLLVRVGAYFHDIGKMFKPEYFIENQGQGPNQHSRLQPAMSTLVIIAHVKDGADLARSHKLPETIVDFVLQHHGTTVVEYFYREAKNRSEEDPHGEEVSDNDFRYPGPKPQTLEAAVLMLSDCVESASRTLVDPTPSRIQSLVESLAMKRLTEGQFDECGLTFVQLTQIKKSLVKSLTAIYHARVKYPGQQSA
jgi:hypothetical protein